MGAFEVLVETREELKSGRLVSAKLEVEFTLDASDNNDVFLTTWHDDESNDEVADFFIYAPTWSDGLKLAMFDDDNPEDQGLKKVLISIAERK